MVEKKGFFSLLGESWKEYKTNFYTILGLFLLLIVILGLVLAYLGIPLLGMSSDQIQNFYKSNRGVLYLMFQVIAMFLSALFSVCIIYIGFNASKKLKFKDALTKGAGYWGKYILVAIVLTVSLFLLALPAIACLASSYLLVLNSMGVSVPLFIVANPTLLLVIGLVLLVVPFFFLIRWLFSYIVLVGENKGGFSALKRSWEVVKGKSWRVLGYMILLAIFIGIFNYIIAIISGFILGYTGNVSFIGEGATQQALVTPAGSFINLIFGFVGKLIVSPLILIFLKNFYLELKGEKK